MQESAKKRGCPEDSLRFFRSKKRGRRRRGQGTVEFIILFSAALFFFVIFMGVIQINIFSNNVDKQKVFLQNICLNVRDEISFAAESSEGYYREFYVPQNALGIEYDINITDQFVFCFFQTYSVSYKTFNVTGQVQKGDNAIRKENETIYINS